MYAPNTRQHFFSYFFQKIFVICVAPHKTCCIAGACAGDIHPSITATMPNQRHPDKRVYNYWMHRNTKDRLETCAEKFGMSVNEVIDVCVKSSLDTFAERLAKFNPLTRRLTAEQVAEILDQQDLR